MTVPTETIRVTPADFEQTTIYEGESISAKRVNIKALSGAIRVSENYIDFLNDGLFEFSLEDGSLITKIFIDSNELKGAPAGDGWDSLAQTWKDWHGQQSVTMTDDDDWDQSVEHVKVIEVTYIVDDTPVTDPEVQNVIDLIGAIGTVELTPECRQKIDDAYDAYQALTDEQKALVTNVGVLDAANAAYQELVYQAWVDHAIDEINAIGDVTYSAESKEAIDEARAAYDALTDDQKALVTNIDTLTAAEQAYAAAEPQDQVSATISDQITFNFLLDLDKRPGAQTITVVHKDQNGNVIETLTFDADSLTKEGQFYRLSIPVAPAQGADRFELAVDGEPIAQDIYSVKDYCEYIISNGADEAFAPYVDFAKAMLEYCQAANAYFGYTEAFAGTEIAQASVDTVSQLENHMSVNANGNIKSISYMAVMKPEFRFYVNPDNGLTEADYVALNDKITVTGDNDALLAKVKVQFVKNIETGAILLEVTGIEAAYLDDVITITIDGFGTITFCGYDFARMLSKNASTAILGAALYNYGAEANACFTD